MGENRNHLRLQHVKTIPERKTLVHPNPCHLYNTSSHFGANNFTFFGESTSGSMVFMC